MWKDITTLCERYYRELERFLLRRVHSPDTDALPGPGNDVIRRRGDEERGNATWKRGRCFGIPKWERSFRSDDGGRVMLQTLWSGRSVVDFAHVEVQPGEAGGGTCNRLPYVSILASAVEEDVASLDQ
jgi:hypothetical protein